MVVRVCRRGEGEGREQIRTQTLKLRFLYFTDSTLKPIVGIVVTTSPTCSALAPLLLACCGATYLEPV